MWKTKIQSPVSELFAFASEQGLTALSWPGSKNTEKFSNEVGCQRNDSHEIFVVLKRQLSEYFAGKRMEFDVPLDLSGTEFQLKAWDALLQIPYGQTRTYSEQAVKIGRPKAVRAVGAANGRNPISILVPCHRVVGANGSLTGFAGGIEIKRYLIEMESKTVLV